MFQRKGKEITAKKIFYKVGAYYGKYTDSALEFERGIYYPFPIP